MKPSTTKILNHMRSVGSITPMESLVVYGNPRLAASIYEIRKSGINVWSEFKRDPIGHKYTRYYLEV